VIMVLLDKLFEIRPATAATRPSTRPLDALAETAARISPRPQRHGYASPSIQFRSAKGLAGQSAGG
jgi:hypothetical protein